MLVLSRFPSEKIIIADSAGKLMEIMVVECKQNRQVKLGFDAPENLKIYREEIWIEKQKCNSI